MSFEIVVITLFALHVLVGLFLSGAVIWTVLGLWLALLALAVLADATFKSPRGTMFSVPLTAVVLTGVTVFVAPLLLCTLLSWALHLSTLTFEFGVHLK